MPVSVNIKKGELLELLIEKLVYGEDGLAHHGTQACFVSDVVPEEKVVAKVDKIKSQYLFATAVEILIPSSSRTDPVCPLFYTCGGCQWQHMEYEHQLYWKQENVKECLTRIAGIKEIKIPLPVASSPFNYRSRARLKVKSGTKPVIGFYRRKSHSVIPVENCALLAAPLNRALNQCREILTDNPAEFNDVSEIDMLGVTRSSQVLISFKYRKKNKSRQYLLGGDLTEPSLTNEMFSEEINGMFYQRDNTAFYQSNFMQNIELINLVIKYLSACSNDKILELFCGTGNFSLFLARAGAEVFGVESNACSINQAIANAEMNSIGNCNFIKADVDKIPQDLLRSGFSGVLMNPPRTGCSEKILNEIVLMDPDIIVYVSCNPSTLARDLKKLVKSGYIIDKIQPVDMFPQTYHIETVVKLVKY